MLKKIIIAVLIILVAAFLYFVYWGSRPTLSANYYDQLRNHIKLRVQKPDTMTAMTFNVGYMSGMTNNLPVDRDYSLFANNLERAISLVDRYHPSFVGLQEVDFIAERSFYQNQLDSIVVRCEYPWSFRSVNWDKRYVPFPYWPFSDHFGNVISGQAILSDYPVTNAQRLVLKRPDQFFLRDAFYISRLLQFTDVDLGGISIRVMNVHLEAFDEETRIAQAKTVKDIYELYSDRFAIIIMGDFNSEPPSEESGSEAMKIILSAKNIRSAIDLEDYNKNKEINYTYSSEEPQRKIDYILYNDNFIKKIDAKVLHEAGEISDHLPVYFKFYIYHEIDFFRPFR